MSNPLRSPADYESFIYSLREQFPVIRRFTVRLVRRGATLAQVVGELYFDKNVRLSDPMSRGLRPLRELRAKVEVWEKEAGDYDKILAG